MAHISFECQYFIYTMVLLQQARNSTVSLQHVAAKDLWLLWLNCNVWLTRIQGCLAKQTVRLLGTRGNSEVVY